MSKHFYISPANLVASIKASPKLFLITFLMVFTVPIVLRLITPEVYKVETTFILHEEKISWLNKLLTFEYKDTEAVYENETKELANLLASTQDEILSLLGDPKQSFWDEYGIENLEVLSTRRLFLNGKWPSEKMPPTESFRPKLLHRLSLVGKNPGFFLRTSKKDRAIDSRIGETAFNKDNFHSSVIPNPRISEVVVNLIIPKETFETRYDENFILGKLQWEAGKYVDEWLRKRNERFLMMASIRNNHILSLKEAVKKDLFRVEKALFTWTRVQNCTDQLISRAIDRLNFSRKAWLSSQELKSGEDFPFYVDVCVQDFVKMQPYRSYKQYERNTYNFRGVALSEEKIRKMLEKNSVQAIVRRIGSIKNNLTRFENLLDSNDFSNAVSEMEEIRPAIREAYLEGLLETAGPPRIVSRGSIKSSILFSSVLAIIFSIFASLIYGFFKGRFDGNTSTS